MNYKRTVFTAAMVLGFVLFTAAGASAQTSDTCAYWQEIADPRVDYTGTATFDRKNPQTIMEGIECLLKLEGRRHKSNHGGATNIESSQTFGLATVEVAALYYISYLYYQKWDHAMGMALVSKKGKSNLTKSSKTAFKSYKKWFAEVKRVGLEKAREMKLDPLAGSGVRWYGN